MNDESFIFKKLTNRSKRYVISSSDEDQPNSKKLDLDLDYDSDFEKSIIFKKLTKRSKRCVIASSDEDQPSSKKLDLCSDDDFEKSFRSLSIVDLVNPVEPTFFGPKFTTLGKINSGEPILISSDSEEENDWGKCTAISEFPRFQGTCILLSSDSEVDKSEPKVLPDKPKIVHKKTKVHSKASSDPNKLTSTQFKRQRKDLTQSLYKSINERVMKGKLPSDMAIVWTNTLRTTAGRFFLSSTNMNGRIELNSKILDSYSRLQHTLAHEMCHAADRLVEGNKSRLHHGKNWRKWAKRVAKVYPDFNTSACHDYTIAYKHWYRCINPSCGKVEQRHSKSINIDRDLCRRCNSRYEYLPKDHPDRLEKENVDNDS